MIFGKLIRPKIGTPRRRMPPSRYRTRRMKNPPRAEVIKALRLQQGLQELAHGSAISDITRQANGSWLRNLFSEDTIPELISSLFLNALQKELMVSRSCHDLAVRHAAKSISEWLANPPKGMGGKEA